MTKSQEFISQMAQWEKDRRTANRGLSKDDKQPAISSLTGEQLDEAIANGSIEVS